MELRICHLYPELLNLNGDPGNVAILSYRAKSRGIAVCVQEFTVGETFSPEDYDLVFLGNGQEEELSAVYADLYQYHRDALKSFVKADGVFLAVGGGYRILGETVINTDGTSQEGLALLPIQTTLNAQRMIGNTIVKEGEHIYIGFKNQSERTDIGSLSPLGEVLLGFGNTSEGGYEGCRYRNVIGTHLHGPFLSKAPELADELITAALTRRYGEVELSTLPDLFEKAAKEQLIQRFLPEN